MLMTTLKSGQKQGEQSESTSWFPNKAGPGLEGFIHSGSQSEPKVTQNWQPACTMGTFVYTACLCYRRHSH